MKCSVTENISQFLKLVDFLVAKQLGTSGVSLRAKNTPTEKWDEFLLSFYCKTQDINGLLLLFKAELSHHFLKTRLDGEEHWLHKLPVSCRWGVFVVIKPKMVVIWQHLENDLDLKTPLCPLKRAAAGADRSFCTASAHRPCTLKLTKALFG